MPLCSSIAPLRLGKHFILVTGFLVGILSGGCTRRAAWQLTDIRGHLPDLQLSLSTAGNSRLTAADFRGKVVLLYFGYLHCPDVCPLTMAQLATAVGRLGPSASRVRILFISVDPQRDTPQAVAQYAQAFSRSAVGATGTPAEIEALAKRYRVAYQAEAADADGNYEVTHSKLVFVFDQLGRARLLIDDTAKADPIAHDVRALLASD